MTPEEYIHLYERYMAGNCSPEEKQTLFNYSDQFRLQEPNRKLSVEDRKARLLGYRRLKDRLSRSRPIIRLRTLWAAAAMLVTFIITVLVLFRGHVNQPIPVTVSAPIAPGMAMAVLTLSSGEQIRLNDVRNGVIAKAAGSTISKTKNGELVYQADDRVDHAESSNNTISIPAGGEYRLTLSDGTNVWLNSASRLSYPTRFSGTKREVELNGEAYFEVAKNKKVPFIVHAGNTKTEVLGTHFNVMAYEEESLIKATLMEGSIRFAKGTANALLKPGEQAMTTKEDEQVHVAPADTAEAMAWKSGYFMFKNENIKSLMRRIARWYDVKVTYEGDVGGRTFGGTFSKKKNLTELLTNLEQIGTVHFKMKGRSIIVMP